eukprot:9478241-Pyramimonas_sp.AAC.1
MSWCQGHGYLWDMWETYLEPFSSRVPTHVAVGNHEHCYEALLRSTPDPSGAPCDSHPRIKP